MIRLLTATLLFTSFSVVADDLKTFSDGQVIEADDFNHNFQKLEQDIADIPAGADGADGTDGADGVVNGVTCTTDQVIVYRGGAWVCSSPQIVEQLFSGSGGGDITCPSPKKVTAGGCEFVSPGNCDFTRSAPLANFEGWKCSVLGASCGVVSGYAICQ